MTLWGYSFNSVYTENQLAEIFGTMRFDSAMGIKGLFIGNPSAMTVDACVLSSTYPMPCPCALKQSFRIKTTSPTKVQAQMLPSALVTKKTLNKSSDGSCPVIAETSVNLRVIALKCLAKKHDYQMPTITITNDVTTAMTGHVKRARKPSLQSTVCLLSHHRRSLFTL